MNFLKEFGQRIKELRLKANMTQEELAIKAGYTSRSSINKIETGLVDIPQSKIEIFAQILKTTPAYLMGWDSENITPQLSEQQEALQTMYFHLGKEAQDMGISQNDIDLMLQFFRQHKINNEEK